MRRRVCMLFLVVTGFLTTDCFMDQLVSGGQGANSGPGGTPINGNVVLMDYSAPAEQAFVSASFAPQSQANALEEKVGSVVADAQARAALSHWAPHWIFPQGLSERVAMSSSLSCSTNAASVQPQSKGRMTAAGDVSTGELTVTTPTTPTPTSIPMDSSNDYFYSFPGALASGSYLLAATGSQSIPSWSVTAVLPDSVNSVKVGGQVLGYQPVSVSNGSDLQVTWSMDLPSGQDSNLIFLDLSAEAMDGTALSVLCGAPESSLVPISGQYYASIPASDIVSFQQSLNPVLLVMRVQLLQIQDQNATLNITTGRSAGGKLSF